MFYRGARNPSPFSLPVSLFPFLFHSDLVAVIVVILLVLQVKRRKPHDLHFYSIVDAEFQLLPFAFFTLLLRITNVLLLLSNL
jgi:hypothetical protein